MRTTSRKGDYVGLKERLGAVLQMHDEILVAYLYGSTVEGYGRKTSDIDVGLLLREGFEADALYPVQIAGEIRKKGGVEEEVDVRILNGRAFRFLHRVITRGEVITSRDERERIKFETSVIDQYIDFKPFLQQYDEKRRERLLNCA